MQDADGDLAAPRTEPARPRALVVDDSPNIRRLIQMNLELEGFEVLTASDGEHAFELAVQSEPDVVTLDVVMPRLDGFATAERLKRDPRTQHLKVVMVTSASQATDFQRAERAGVDGYLTKPFDPDRLVALVTSLLPPERRPAPRG